MAKLVRSSGSASSLRGKPTGLLRWVFRIPTWLYRRSLGWVLGHRFLQLTHRGRKTGQLRQAVLEVVYYNPATCESVVVSGWGTESDWYRNIRAHPAVAVQTGWRRYELAQRFLAPEEAAMVAARFARDHPIEARIAPRILRWLGWSSGDEHANWRSMATEIPMVAFRPRA